MRQEERERRERKWRGRRSKTHHNGICPPSPWRKMKFFPKVLSVEEAMMDG